MGLTEVAQVDKRPYRNQTAGWLGVVKLNHLGAQEGHSVEPHGAVWLTDDEATLTARAPAKAKDNPFVAKPYMFTDEQGQHVEQDMVPLVLIADDREVPGDDRPTPITVAGPIEASIGADARNAADALAADSSRPVAGAAIAPDDVTLAPASSAAVHPSLARPAPEPPPVDDEQPPSWVENPDRTEEPQPGNLGGSNDPAPGAQQGSDGGPSGASPAATAAVTSPAPGAQADAQEKGQAAAAEEHAAHTQAGEETGAAATPAQKPAEGEFAAHEEVGSPDAPAQGEGEAS